MNPYLLDQYNANEKRP